jgi:hypothetical protein
MFIAIPTLFITACAGGSSDDSGSDPQSNTGDSAGRAALDSAAVGDPLTAEQREGVAAQSAETVAGVPLLEREVIATAEVTIRVDDVSASLPDVIRAATAAGGYVAGEDTSNDPDEPTRTRSTLVLRVPTGSLPRVLNEVSDVGELLKSRQDVRDVTEQVVDVESRVKSARASVNRIRVLLDQARTLGQVVRIESQLARREADLESLLAQQRALEDQTAMATLTTTVLGPTAASPAPEEAETGFLAGLTRGWNALVDAMVVGMTGVGLLLPFAVVAGLVLVPLGLVWRRRQGRPLAESS